jgi:hypothetical protein
MKDATSGKLTETVIDSFSRCTVRREYRAEVERDFVLIAKEQT